MRRRLAVICILMGCQWLAYGQTARPWEQAFEAVTAAEDAESAAWEEAYDLLCQLEDNKINLNQATREQLEQLPFLTAQQVEGIIEYVYRYGPVRTLGELQMVTALDADRRQLLEHFIYVGEQAQRDTTSLWQKALRYGRHELMATVRAPFYERKGDRNGYLGYRYKHWMRYQFAYGDHMKVGITGSQDAGEPFLANKNSLGYDHYSYYFQLRNMGRLEALNLGMYRVQMGMGLVMNTGFSLGKMATLQSLGRSSSILRANASRTESDYLQGVAATVRLDRQWKATAFVSYRPIDATLNDDGTARTLLTTGYHRTPTEMEKKHNTHQTTAGTSLGWRSGALHVNANAVFTHLDRDLVPQRSGTLYRRYYTAGNDFLNVSTDYGYTHYRLAVNGETALSYGGALATINSFSFQAMEGLSLMLLHRYYARNYNSLYARSFSENTRVQNEHGLYVGATWHPLRSLQLMYYADYAHFEWPRYQVSSSSDAFDTMLSLQYVYRLWTLSGRYRLHIRQRDNADKTWIINRTEHRGRLSATYNSPQGLLLHMQADLVSVDYRTQEWGWMVSERIGWQWRWLQVTANAAYFHTDSYESRLYQYEPATLYTFSFPMYYGEGLRCALRLRADLGRHLMLTVKAAMTNYFDRSTIGSGLQQIDGSSMTDLDVQLRWKF